AEGVLAPPGTQDPAEEVEWLEEELVAWITSILSKDFERHARSVELEGTKVEELVHARLTGLSISPNAVAAALRAVPVDRAHPASWTREERRQLARALLLAAKPRMVAANKADRSTPEAVEALRERVAPIPVAATCAEAELTLRRAARAGLVTYRPGDPSFSEPDGAPLSAAQRRALDEVRAIQLRWGSTGVQSALERMVFERLGQMVVFPVEDEQRWTDSRGRVLPDALIVPTHTPARALAYRVHTDLGEHFIRAIDGRTHRALGAEHPLEPGSIVRIVARK
ncbi:MAG TPA: TGS domain-containing protein, partial [Thermoplasmata archaeon]